MLPNIYESKHYKLMIIIPVALLLLSFYFIPKIQLDTSLRGGINVQVQTNSSMDIRQLTQSVDSALPGAQASIQMSPGGLSITIATNASLANAETHLLSIYNEYGNYTAAVANFTLYQNMLTSYPGNSTILSRISNATSQRQKSLTELNVSLSAELSALGPPMSGSGYNSSDAAGMLALAKSAYTSASAAYESKVVAALKGIIPFSSYSYDSVTPSLAASFLSQMANIIIWSFILLAISVFVIFRNPIPSITVVFGAANDILVALGAMAVFGIPLGVASIGGILMLLGYSIDTDLLAAVKILKRTEGTPQERAFSTFKTGVTMTISAILSFSILFIVSYLAFIPTYYEISGVVLIGLIVDIVCTWCADTPMVLWYKQKKDARL